MKYLLALLCLIALESAGQNKPVSAKFIGYQTIPFEKDKQGGISGIEYNPKDDKWYLGSDKGIWDLYTFRITYDDNGVNPPVRLDSFDLGPIRNIEAIRLDTSGNQQKFILVNEPDDINELADIFSWNPAEKEARVKMQIPSKLHPFKDNKGFEGLVLDKSGNYWIASEQAREADGKMIRFSHIDKNTSGIIEQYAFEYDASVCKDNGVSEILMIDEKRFLVLDRCYDGCKVFAKLYQAEITSQSVDVKDKEALANMNPNELMTKKEVLNINSVLFPDNLEAMTWGPSFPDGSKALVIVSDDNLKKKAPQITQVVVFKISGF
ncbi:Uncharacterized conserved protein [Pseudarcicella hirudinis]|uniref:Uncharacterized conserved protein n=2 Tax=Pseudarcicella hirudinis TaxID=1079859 RepID=A0A1I5YIX2_9BACT|nr:esterase-like activity of phytase family protein [Pseudarcicella hirudinis]SFQ44146.1 Uncharacterized conserved protein [Pseudarcicella hirudinis]